MIEVRDKLICYLQELIDKRLVDKKSTSVTNLVGIVSQFKEFREWLQNNFKHDFKLNLLKLIQEDSHHFNYDFMTGTVTNVHRFERNSSPVSTSIVIKPNLINDLESDKSMDSFENNSLVLELILFVTTEVFNESMSVSVSYLLESISTNCEKQFNCYKSMVKIKDKSKDSDENVLTQLTTNHLKLFFSFDSSQKILSINTNNLEIYQIFDFLTKTCLVVFKNCLVRILYRFGRRYSFDLNHWFANNYKIADKFMANRGITLDLIIGLYPEVFEVQNMDRINRIVNLNPKIMGKTRSLELELMYKYGAEIRGIAGLITRVTESSATIESQIDFEIKDQNFRPTFKAITELVKVFGQQICDLSTFMHSGDQLYFDVQFITTFSTVLYEESSNHLWLVSRIYKVRHTANCYVHSIFDDWKYGKWNINWSDSESIDSDSDYDRYESHASDSDLY